MKSVVLYGRRNTGLLALSYLWAKFWPKIEVISDDPQIIEFAKDKKIKLVDFDTMCEFDIFICVHGDKIIPSKYLVDKHMINIHPCLFKYKGKDPISRYIKNEDTEATVESHFIIEEVDAGDVIHVEKFTTGRVSSHSEFYNLAYPFYLKCLYRTLDKLSNTRRCPLEISSQMGKKFGMLTAIEFVRWQGHSHPMVLFKCECGNTKVQNFFNVQSGKTISCGCLQKDIVKKTMTKHGKSQERKSIYFTWRNMISRCTNVKNVVYANYGGRGITVCNRWMGDDGFVNFLSDMGERPSLLHSLDRIDNNKGYYMENCRWATRSVQNNNTRSVKQVNFKGEILTVTELSNRSGLPTYLIRDRLNKGWSDDKLVSPKKKYTGRKKTKY